MPISLDTLFGIHERAVALRSQRAELLAANLSNADTPNYKARDIDFAEALAKARAGHEGTELVITNDRHIPASMKVSDLTVETQYHTPFQPTVDGNTVDTAIEQAKFLDNAMHYQASLTFLSGRIRSLLTAIREE
jgi:flagellar basal-body rod protein FlgB